MYNIILQYLGQMAKIYSVQFGNRIFDKSWSNSKRFNFRLLHCIWIKTYSMSYEVIYIFNIHDNISSNIHRNYYNYKSYR